jgi:hypothetical protein
VDAIKHRRIAESEVNVIVVAVQDVCHIQFNPLVGVGVWCV